MSEEEYIPERDNDLESEEEEESNNDLLKIQDKALKDIIKEGGLRVENIIEIQWMMELIKFPKIIKINKIILRNVLNLL